jgi:D-alanyl-D-alanine carboxypeptidase
MRRTMLFYLHILILLFATTLPAIAQGLPDASSALDFIAEHPEDVAVLCYTADEAPAVDHQADEPFPLASTYKLVILAELARQVEAGDMDMSEEVPLADVNAYWLPLTDGNAHQMFLDSLPSDQETLTIEEVATAMMQFSSNAAPDYLLSRLGLDGFPELFEQLGLENTDLPNGMFLGLYLAYDNHETGALDLDDVEVDAWMAERQRLEMLFLTDDEWRDAELVYVQERLEQSQQLIEDEDYDAITAEYERQVAYFGEFGAQGSARDMLTILESAYQGDVFTEAGQTVMQSVLDWLMDANPANRAAYDALATKGGWWSSIMTSVWYADPTVAEPIVLAVFYRNLPIELWGEWATTFAYQTLELRAIAYGEGCDVFADALE